MQPLRILHCPAAIGGHPQQLARSEREIGLASIAVSFTQNYLKYDGDEVLLQPGQGYAWLELRRWQLLRRALRDFDVIHFNFGQSIMPNAVFSSRTLTPAVRAYRMYALRVSHIDLPILKRAGKGIVVTYQGDEARFGSLLRQRAGSRYIDERPEQFTPTLDGQKQRSIAMFSRYADQIFTLNPDLLPGLPPGSEFLPYASVDLKEWQPPETRTEPHRFTIIHAPTHRAAKGTPYIIEAVRRLQEEDQLDFDFILVEGMSREEAKRIYFQADLLIDQLVIGWYGGLAVELMALGKPVVAHLHEDDLQRIPPAMSSELPIIPATHEDIYAVLKTLLTKRRHQLAALGAQGRIFVEHWHDPLKIARQMKDVYERIMSRKKGSM